MTNKKKFALGGIIIIVLTALYIGAGAYSSFSQQESAEDTVDIYFFDAALSKLVTERHILPPGSNKDDASYLWGLMALGPTTQGLSGVFPDNFSHTDTEQLSVVSRPGDNSPMRDIEVYLSSEYLNVDPAQEIVFRTAVARTFLELNWVNEVYFKVDGIDLLRLDGTPVGPMNKNNLLINPQVTKEKEIKKTVELYFANEAQTGLVAERRVISVPSNVSEEKVVLSELLKGPATSGLVSLIPSETVINDVNTETMTCYVDLSPAFDNRLPPGTQTRKLAVYSIVNTLTGLSKGDVTKVQFLINAERTVGRNIEIDLSRTFEADPSLIIEQTYEDEI